MIGEEVLGTIGWWSPPLYGSPNCLLLGHKILARLEMGCNIDLRPAKAQAKCPGQERFSSPTRNFPDSTFKEDQWSSREAVSIERSSSYISKPMSTAKLAVYSDFNILSLSYRRFAAIYACFEDILITATAFFHDGNEDSKSFLRALNIILPYHQTVSRHPES